MGSPPVALLAARGAMLVLARVSVTVSTADMLTDVLIYVSLALSVLKYQKLMPLRVILTEGDLKG